MRRCPFAQTRRGFHDSPYVDSCDYRAGRRRSHHYLCWCLYSGGALNMSTRTEAEEGEKWSTWARSFTRYWLSSRASICPPPGGDVPEECENTLLLMRKREFKACFCANCQRRSAWWGWSSDGFCLNTDGEAISAVSPSHGKMRPERGPLCRLENTVNPRSSARCAVIVGATVSAQLLGGGHWHFISIWRQMPLPGSHTARLSEVCRWERLRMKVAESRENETSF